MKKLILFLFPLLLLCGNFVSCSDGEKEEQLVKSYAYKLNCAKTEKETGTFHRVQMFNSVDNGDGTYNVKEYEMHYFSTDNSEYATLTGNKLCNIVRKGAIKSSKNYNLTLDEKKLLQLPIPLTTQKKNIFSQQALNTLFITISSFS